MGGRETYFRGEYFMGGLTEDEAKKLLFLQDECKCVENLKNCIKYLSLHDVSRMLQDVQPYITSGTLDAFDVSGYQNGKVGLLRDSQTIGVAFAYIAGSLLIGDDVGLGKTVQIAGLCNLLRDFCAQNNRRFSYCFLTEKTSVGQIQKKMIRFTGEYVLDVLSAKVQDIELYLKVRNSSKSVSMVGSHGLLESPRFITDFVRNPYNLLVVDESKVLKNSTVKAYKGVEALLKACPGIRFVELNATPVEVSPMDIYNQLNLLHPNYMPTKADFTRKYCEMSRGVFGWKVSGAKTKKSSNVSFGEAIKLRCKASSRVEEGAEFVGNVCQAVYIPLTDMQKMLLRKSSLHQMVYDYPPGVDVRIQFSPETTPKAGAVLHIIKNKLDIIEGKCMIYCFYKDCQLKLANLLSDNGYKCVILNGDTADKKRDMLVSAFNEGDYDIIITNIQRGLDLDTCENCILYTINPNPQELVQSSGRIMRDFNVVGKTIYLLVMDGKEKDIVDEVLVKRIKASDVLFKEKQHLVTSALKGNVQGVWLRDL